MPTMSEAPAILAACNKKTYNRLCLKHFYYFCQTKFLKLIRMLDKDIRFLYVVEYKDK